MTPFNLFENWYEEELSQSKLEIPSACCLSTIGLDAYPNARFVSLKEINDDRFVVTSPMHSRKGREMLANPAVALTFWWTATKRQVRLQGTAVPIPDSLADSYFDARGTEAKLVSTLSQQGAEINDLNALKLQYKHALKNTSALEIQRPEGWGGFFIKPIRIEFMDFHESRFHERKLFKRVEGKWETKVLQP